MQGNCSLNRASLARVFLWKSSKQVAGSAIGSNVPRPAKSDDHHSDAG